MCFCPYHGNKVDPAFTVGKNNGWGYCQNPSCSETVTLERLVRDMLKVSHLEAKRLIFLKRNSDKPFSERFDSIKVSVPELKEFSQAAIDRMHERFWGSPGHEYMNGRGFTDETLEYFKTGFSEASQYDKLNINSVSKPDSVMVPVWDNKGRPVGLVSRSIKDKGFKYFGPGEHGTGFHKSQVIYNLQNARKYETIILVEASFDAKKIHQAGYPNVGALLGGSLSRVQEELIKRHFTRVIIFTDNDKPEYYPNCRKCLKKGVDLCLGHRPGRDLGLQIVDRLQGLRVHWATDGSEGIYPRGVKDATDMQDDEIRSCLRGAISHYEYLDWQVA